MSSISSVRLPRSRLVDADRLVLGVVPADAGAEDDPVLGEELERRQLLGEEHRVAQRHDQDRRPEADALRDAGGDRQRRERLEERHRVEPLRGEQVVGDEQRVEAEVLDLARERLDAARPLASRRPPRCRRAGRPRTGRPRSFAGPRCRRPQRPRYSGGRFSTNDRAPFEQVVRREDPHRRLDLRGVALHQRPVERVVDERLDGSHGERPALGDLFADRACPRDRLTARHDLVDEADPLGVGCGR